MTRTSRLAIASVLTLAAGSVAPTAQRASGTSPALVIQEQGSFGVGGTVVTAPGTFDPIAQGAYNPAGGDPRGQTLHGDHAYVFYQIPVNPRRLPLVFWHGHGQSHLRRRRQPHQQQRLQELHDRQGDGHRDAQQSELRVRRNAEVGLRDHQSRRPERFVHIQRLTDRPECSR